MSRRKPRAARDARGVAFEVLSSIESRGAFLQPALEAAVQRGSLDGRERGLALELVMGVTRWQARIDHALAPLLRRGVDGTSAPLLIILRLGVYQIVFLDRIPDRAAVHTAVDLGKQVGGNGAARLINGVLREFQRRGESLPEGEDSQSLAIRWSHPEWLVERLLDRGGLEYVRAMCEANNKPAPLTIRPDAPSMERDELAVLLEAEGATVTPGAHCPDALHISGHPSPFGGASFGDGAWTVQDEASQLVVRLLNPKPDERIWDVCAAPGGKTRYIARLMKSRGFLVATDVNARKVESLRKQLDASWIDVRVHDAGKPWGGESFDRVLVDAPCTALGTIRRHPEIRWRRGPDDIGELAERQDEILSAAADAVKPGGILVYSVCTGTFEEGPRQISRFLENRSEFSLDFPEDDEVGWAALADDGTLRLNPAHHGTDGFFAARLRRRETP